MPPDAHADTPTVYHISKDPQVLHDLKNIGSTMRLMIYSAIDRLQFDPRPSGCIPVPGSSCVKFVVKETQPRYRLTYEVNDNQATIVVISIQPTGMPDRQAGVSLNRKSPWEAGSFYLVALVVLMVTIAAISYVVGSHAVVVVIGGALSALVVIAAFVLYEVGMLSPAQMRSLISDGFGHLFHLLKRRTPSENVPE